MLLRSLGNGTDFASQQTYEVADLLRRYEAGIVGDNYTQLRAGVELLFNDVELRKKYSRNIRLMAIDLFAHEKIKKQWKEFLKV